VKLTAVRAVILPLLTAVLDPDPTKTQAELADYQINTKIFKP